MTTASPTITPRAIPRVPGYPVVGSLLEYRADRFGFLERLGSELPEMARMRMGLVPVLVTSSADIAHEALVEKPDAFTKGPGLAVFGKPLLGGGLLASEGALHKRQRRLMAPAFVQKRIAGYAAVIASRTEAAQAAWTDGAEIDVGAAMMRLTLEIVGKTLFDAEIGADAKDVGEALTAVMEHLIGTLMSLVPLPPQVPTRANRRALAAVARLDELVYRMIREHRAHGGDRGDFLSMLLLAQDEDDGSVMTDKQVRDEAMTIVLAGHETTANALAWTYHLLGQHPAARDRLEREAASALGGRIPTLADLPRLPYALQVLKEAMRLYPPAYVFSRRAIRDVTLAGYHVPRGRLMLFNIAGMHHRADYFPEPYRFDPDRFTPDREKALPRQAYMPFGAGPRICIGNHFALMEGQIVLAALAQRVRFDPLPGSRRVETEPLVTLRPRGGLPMRVQRRAPQA
jgi:cytochrome P450